MVEYHPISAKYISRLHQFCPKVLPSMFLGYVFYAAGIWIGDIMVADIEELEQMDASELHARRLNAKEVLTQMKGDNFLFLVANETVKASGGDQRLRTSTLTREAPERGEEQEVLRAESDGLSSQTSLQDDTTLDDAEARNDFWSITGDFIWTQSQIVHVERRNISYSDEVHRRYQNDSYNPRCNNGETY